MIRVVSYKELAAGGSVKETAGSQVSFANLCNNSLAPCSYVPPRVMLDCIWLISATQMLADIDSIDQIPIIADSPIGVSLCNF